MDDDFGEVPEFLTKPEILAEMDLNKVQVPNLDLRPDYWIWVQEILENTLKGHEVCAFGSRTKWINREGSDLDLVVMDEVSFKEICAAEEAFRNSLLPMRVDVGQWLKMTEDFQNRIRKDLVKLTNRNDELPNGWRKVKLGDVIDIFHGFAFKGKYFTENPTKYFLVTPGNFSVGGGFRQSKNKFYTGDFPEEYILKANDLIVTMTDLSKQADTLGYSALVPISSEYQYLHNQRIGKVILLSEEVSKDFLYWLMRTSAYRGEIIGSASGSTVKHTSPSRIKNFSFLLPPLPEQKAIAEVLDSLDDKIRHNKEQNKILEEMAQALFQDWFVHFGPVKEKIQAKKENRPEKPYLAPEIWNRFPDTLNENGIPEGWEEQSISTLGDIICGKTPSTKKLEFYGDDVPFITIPDMHGKIFVDETKKSLSIVGAKTQSKKTLPPLSICVSCIATPGLVVLTTKNSQTNQQINSIIPHDMQHSFFIYETMLNLFKEILSLGSGGSVFFNLNTAHFKEMKFLCPNNHLIIKFHYEAQKIFEKIRQNEEENQKLSEMRDTLLPRLISGKIRVNF